jgi:hypothetical protein
MFDTALYPERALVFAGGQDIFCHYALESSRYLLPRVGDYGWTRLTPGRCLTRGNKGWHFAVIILNEDRLRALCKTLTSKRRFPPALPGDGSSNGLLRWQNAE